MGAQDFYDTLGVARSATADDVRKAYRKQARLYHPDVNKEPDAPAKFAAVQRAYDVLSDEKKRALYDKFGPEAFESNASEEAAARAARGGPHYAWQNVAGARGGGGGNVDLDQEDISSIFESMFGGAAGGGARGSGRGKRRANGAGRRAAPIEPLRHEIEVDFLVMAKGGSESIRLTDGRTGASKVVEVKVPAGIEPTTPLRLASVGPGGQDVLLTIKARPHAWFRRGTPDEPGKGLDLTIELPLTIAEATLGADVAVPTLEGTVELSIPAGSASGRRLRLRAKGIQEAGGKNVGDLYALVKIVPPKGTTLSEEEAQVLRRVSQTMSPVRAWEA
jgi:curved DNA-binding protein